MDDADDVLPSPSFLFHLPLGAQMSRTRTLSETVGKTSMYHRRESPTVTAEEKEKLFFTNRNTPETDAGKNVADIITTAGDTI